MALSVNMRSLINRFVLITLAGGFISNSINLFMFKTTIPAYLFWGELSILPGAALFLIVVLMGRADWSINWAISYVGVCICDMLLIFANLYRIYGLNDSSPISHCTHDGLTCLYFSIITFTTTGFGDITPMHGYGRVAAATEALSGYFVLGLTVSALPTIFRGRRTTS